MPVSPATPTSASGALLADATRLGPAELTVTRLDRSVAFYHEVVGLRVHRRDDASAVLGAGAEEVIVLHESPAARPPGRHAGLYHVALLYPSRAELARAAARVAATRTPIQGASDHGTHEAIYLPDPDGNGLELAADRPRGEWPDLSGPGGYAAGPAPLDVRALLDAVAGEPSRRQAEPGLRVGHVHLHVGDLDATRRFYVDGLGLEVMTDLGSALFFSFAGYHHHVGANVWRGPGVPPAPDDVVGLRHWTLLVASAGELAAVRDRLAAGGAPEVERPDGLLARDPAGIAVLVRT